MIEPKRLMEIEAATLYECPQHEAGMAGLACSCLPAMETRTMFRELIEVDLRARASSLAQSVKEPTSMALVAIYLTADLLAQVADASVVLETAA